MTKQKILEDFSKEAIKELIPIFNEISLKNPIIQKEEKHYEFKNDYFNKEITITKNDFDEFFSRKEIKSRIEKISDYTDIVDIIAGYSNTKIYSERGIDAENLFNNFIEKYFFYVNDLKFVESKFNYIFKSFLKFLDSEILYVHYFTPLFRLLFPSKSKQKDLGDIKLTKITGEQFKIIKESLVGNRSTPGYLRKLSYVLEVVIPFKNNAEQEDSVANALFTKFLNAAHLFDEGDLKIGALYKNFTPWMNNSSKILNLNDVRLGSKIFKLNTNSYKKLKIFYCEFCDVDLDDKDWSFIQVAIDRFSSSIFRNDSIDKIVDLNVALECLFSSAGETSLKISNRTAMMVGLDENEHEQCWNFIKNTYRLRNDILHGRKGNDFDISNDVYELEKIIRLSIKKFLNCSKNISRTELKSQGELKDGKLIRDYLLDELDLGLINRIKLDRFSNQSKGPFD